MRSLNAKHIAVTLVLGVGLFALTPFLLPSRYEQGIIYIRDKKFEEAFEFFFKEYSSNNHNPTVVVSLARLYLHRGDIDEAIRLLEELSRTRPQDTELLRTLGYYYKSAQLSDDYIRLLEEIRHIDPQESDLRALNDIYNFQARYDDQIGVLQELIDRGWSNARDIATISHLYAADGEIDQALHVFDTVDAKNEGLFDHTVMPLRLSLLIDAGKLEEALSLSRQWREVSKSAPDLWEIAGLFASKGHSEAGLALYEAGTQGPPASLRSRITYGALLVGAQRYQEAYDLLATDVAQAHPLPDAVDVYIQAAYGLGKVAEVVSIFKTMREEISADVLLSAIEAAYHAGLFEAAQELRDQMEPDSLTLRPVLMGKLALSLGEKDAARAWIRRAEAASHLGPTATLDLAALLLEFGRKKSAKRYLKALLSDPHLAGNLLFRAASLVVGIGEGGNEVATFEAYRQQRPAELEVNAAWALVASAAGKRSHVKEWLRTLQGARENTGTLIDLYNMARDAHEFDLALHTATVLRDADPSTKSLIRLVQAQLDAGLHDDLQRTVKAESAAFDQLEIQDAARLSEILLAAGQFETILSSLRHFSSRLEENPTLLTAWSRAEIRGGLAQHAFMRLQELAGVGPLSPSVTTVFIESALAVGKIDVAWDTARGHMSSLPSWLQAGLVELLIAEKKTEKAQAALAELGDDFNRTHPLLPAELALLQGRRRDALRYLNLAANTTGQDVRTTVKLANLWLLADKREEALNHLAAITSFSKIPDTSLMDVAHLYLKLGQVEQGEAYFARLRQRRETRLVSSAWALLAVGGKKRSDARAWIRKTSFSISDTTLLQDIYFAAFQAKAFEVAKDVAEKLWQLAPSHAHRLIRTEALLHIGDLHAALNAGKDLDLQDPRARQTYIAVLTAAVKAGLPGKDSLIALLAEELASASGKDQRRLIFDLFALQAHEFTLPHLARLAATSLNWSELYLEALVATGRDAEAQSLLVTQAMNPDLPDKKRRDFASRLLATGNKEAAAQIYRALVTHYGPKGEDIQNLLYLWGPRPFEEDIAWLVARAKNAPEHERSAWLDIMASVGAGREVVDLAQAWRASGDVSSDVQAAAVRALDEIGAIDELKEALTETLQTENDPKRLRAYTAIAWKRGLSELAYLFGKRVLAMKEEDAQTLKILGYIAHSREDTGEAKSFLERYLKRNGKGDFESHFYMAEALSREGNDAEAADHYRVALEQIASANHTSFAMEHLRGLILQRLMRYDEAIAVFENMLAKHPNHEGLRADLAETLLLRRLPARAYSTIDPGRKR